MVPKRLNVRSEITNSWIRPRSEPKPFSSVQVVQPALARDNNSGKKDTSFEKLSPWTFDVFHPANTSFWGGKREFCFGPEKGEGCRNFHRVSTETDEFISTLHSSTFDFFFHEIPVVSTTNGRAENIAIGMPTWVRHDGFAKPAFSINNRGENVRITRASITRDPSTRVYCDNQNCLNVNLETRYVRHC